MGAKLVLEVTMAEEAAEFLGPNRYDRADPARPGYRNGRRKRRVQVDSGLVEVDAPKVTGALRPPALVLHDGNKAMAAALKAVWRDVPRQRCIAHKIRNVLNRVPKTHQAEVKRALRNIFYAPCLAEALDAVKAFAAQ